MKKYHLATYGCQMNEYDSALIAQKMDMLGCIETATPEDADYIIVNTCSVREKAEDTAIARIFQFKPSRNATPNLKIVICGCMAKNRDPRTPEENEVRELRGGAGPVQENPGTFDGATPRASPHVPGRRHR
jgi:2-methylthioadenine synthetase